MSVIKVTDLVTKSLDELGKAQSATEPAVVGRAMNASRIYADLAEAQGQKTANVIAYLNSDRSAWSETDEAVVRGMLGLPDFNAQEPVEEPEVETDPVPVTASPEPELPPREHDEPRFAPEGESVHAQ
jgi:hypothetical protein